jgi:hypothetical protein
MATTVCFLDEVIPGNAQRDLDLEDDELDALHAQDAGSDHTLCGLAYGEYVPINREGKITCGSCIAKIAYCKSFKKGKDY